MKKFIVLLFLTIMPAYAFELDTPPTSTQTVVQDEGGIKGFFKKLFSKKKKAQTPQFDSTNSGYTGTLPNLKSEYEYKNKKTSDVKDKDTNAEEFFSDEFQKSRTDDPLFLDVILNKDKPGEYTKDMLNVMRFLETFRPVVANHENIQKFNANVNLLDLHARRIERIYKELPEGMSPSYWLLMDLAYKAKILGNLKYEANYYSKFSPVTGTQYDPVYLAGEDDKFLIELDKTIFQIRQINNP